MIIKPITPLDFLIRHEIASDERREQAKGCFDMGEFVRKDDEICLRCYCVIGVLPAHEKADVIAYIQSIDKATASDDVDPDDLWWLAWISCENAQDEVSHRLIMDGEHPMDAHRESWQAFRSRLKLICDYIRQHTTPEWGTVCHR
jgi:hypothetical protein